MPLAIVQIHIRASVYASPTVSSPERMANEPQPCERLAISFASRSTQCVSIFSSLMQSCSNSKTVNQAECIKYKVPMQTICTGTKNPNGAREENNALSQKSDSTRRDKIFAKMFHVLRKNPNRRFLTPPYKNSDGRKQPDLRLQACICFLETNRSRVVRLNLSPTSFASSSGGVFLLRQSGEPFGIP